MAQGMWASRFLANLLQSHPILGHKSQLSHPMVLGEASFSIQMRSSLLSSMVTTSRADIEKKTVVDGFFHEIFLSKRDEASWVVLRVLKMTKAFNCN